MLPTLTPTPVLPSATPKPAPQTAVMIEPGEKLGQMVLEIAKDETGEPSIFNFCSPFIAESDPAIIVRTCRVPQLPYIFIGYGEVAGSLAELDSIWSKETWSLYFDGTPVNLTSFGYFDVDWQGNKLRQWKVALENLTPGEHKLRYTAGKDATWVFTAGASASSPTSSATAAKITYPALGPTANLGQHPYSSEKARLSFLLYLPAEYGKDPHREWPLILYLHGSGSRGNNLDYLKLEGLPKKLEGEPSFPFLVLSPQIENENAYWPDSATSSSLLALLDEIALVYSINPKQIYLTGVSLGGNGTWEIGLRNPGRFAALVPVMGYYGYPFTVPDNICDLKTVPIWAFHGAKDETVPLDAEESLVKALQACEGDVRLTVYPDAGHDIATEVYTRPDIYTWMSSHASK